MIFTSECSITIPPLDILSYIFETTASNQEKPIYISAEKPQDGFTKSQVLQLVMKVGAGLRKSAGVKDGDVVLLLAENSIWYPIITLGILCANGIFTGANPAYTVPELQHQLQVSKAKYVIADRQRLDTARKAAVSAGLAEGAVYVMDERLSPGQQGYSHTVQSLLNHGLHHWQTIDNVEQLSNKIAVLNFSSGTTGLPKACMITHRNIVANAEQNLQLDRDAGIRLGKPNYGSDQVHCAYVPLFHAMGLVTYTVLNIRRSCTTVVMHRFHPHLLLQSIERFRVTYLLLVPPVAVMLIKSPDIARHDISSVQHLVCGAAPLGPETSVRLETVFNGSQARTRQGWGMTEATMAVTLFPPDKWDSTYSSVGYLVPNMKMKIITDEGREAGFGEEGEAVLQGPNVFRGYYGNSEASKEAWTPDGWYKTGDRVMVQLNGLVKIVDRQKELIKVNGFQVSPSELEGQLLEHEGVKDCAVIRVQRGGVEKPQAHIVKSTEDVTAQSILEFMEARTAPHKRLTGGIVFTTEVPKAPSGKILRRMIKDPQREEARARL